MLKKILSSSRYLVLIAVLGSFLISAALFIYGGLETARTLFDIFTHTELGGASSKELTLAAIQLVDLFLLATALYLISLGLYELFIDDSIELPAWLTIHHLDDLKQKLVGIMILVMGVLFLGKLVSWDGKSGLLDPGAAIALMIAALTFFLGQKHKDQ